MPGLANGNSAATVIRVTLIPRITATIENTCPTLVGTGVSASVGMAVFEAALREPLSSDATAVS
jgi:hypothetical protein